MYAEETRIYYAILTGVLILVLIVAVFVVTIIRYQRKKVALHRTRVKAEINAIETERLRIASDLHDDLGATLSAIKLKLQCIEPGTQKNNAIIDKAEQYIDEAMRKMRSISYNIMPQVLQRRGLSDALTELLEMFIEGTSIKINYKCSVGAVDKQTRIHIYRIVQEILNNIIKHAEATQVDFRIWDEGSKIYLSVKDNGKGFDSNAVIKNKSGDGLHNIMARLDVLNAKIYLSTRPSAGVQYEIEIPGNDDRRNNKSSHCR